MAGLRETQRSFELGFEKEAPTVENTVRDFPGGPEDKNPPASAGDIGSVPILEDPTCCGETKPMYCSY